MTLTDPRDRHNLEVTELAFGYNEGPSLRGANGSRERAPDDRLRDEAIQSHFAAHRLIPGCASLHPATVSYLAIASPASLITFAHFVVSASIYPRKCAGVSPATVRP
jgi:hypothetical protein